jgi:hypothetical protein
MGTSVESFAGVTRFAAIPAQETIGAVLVLTRLLGLPRAATAAE